METPSGTAALSSSDTGGIIDSGQAVNVKLKKEKKKKERKKICP